jgi:hypothetical protein
MIFDALMVFDALTLTGLLAAILSGGAVLALLGHNDQDAHSRVGDLRAQPQ